MGKGKKRVLTNTLEPESKKIVKDKITNQSVIESQNTMQAHGGKLWDSLFILVKDNDKDFIYDFCNRIPCQTCKSDFINMLNNRDFNNKTRDQLINILWECRCQIHSKYKKKSLAEYLDYLKL